MRIITIACWLITALVLTGLATWFLTGTAFGINSGVWNLNWFTGISIGGWEVHSGPYEAVGVYNHPVAGVDSLNIDWIAGEVTVKPYDGGELKITEFAQRELQEDEQLKITTSGGMLTIKFRESGRTLRMPQKKLEVLIPRAISDNLNRLLTDTASGGITIDEISADQMKASTVSGAVHISNTSSRTLAMDSMSGSLTASSVLADDLTLESVSGSIRITGSTARRLDCESTSGSINSSGAFDSAKLSSLSGRISHDDSAPRTALNVSSTSGSIDMSGAFEKVNADCISGGVSIRSTVVPDSLKVETTSGRITITVPNEGSITVNHSSMSGSFSSDVPVVIQNRGAQFEISSISGSAKILELD